MRVYVASDHGGFAQKERIEFHYDIENKDPDSKRIDIVDLGPQALEPEDDYPEFAFKVAEAVVTANANLGRNEEESLGILICRSGIGMSIAANKVKGCYAALCTTSQQGRLAREHNHANVLVLDADGISIEDNLQIVRAFLRAQPQGERHQRRVDQIKTFEQENL